MRVVIARFHTLKNSETRTRFCMTNCWTRSMSSTRSREGRGRRSAGWNTSVADSAAGDRPASTSGRDSFGSCVSITDFGLR